MKCIILAGGTGDSLWPLSRKNYPKQFMNIHEGRSLLQETVVRNMAFCDEFIITTNENYAEIINSQMEVFQGLRYRIIYEGLPKGTLSAVSFASMLLNPSELVLVTVSDLVVDGNYKDTILEAKELAKQGNIANVRSMENDQHIGLFICSIGEYTNALKKHFPDVYKTCRAAKRKVRTINRVAHIPVACMESLERISLQRSLFTVMQNVQGIIARFGCKDVDNVLDVSNLDESIYKDNLVECNCRNVNLYNTATRHLVVANGLEDVAVVNTEDATYISARDKVSEIKEIIANVHDEHGMFFDDSRISYRPWGTHEMLALTDTYKVKRITIYPGMGQEFHKHEHRSEQWSIVEGVATVMVDDEVRNYDRFDTVYIPMGASHRAVNNTNEPVVIIETGIGDILSKNDIHHVELKRVHADGVTSVYVPDLIRLEPAFKDNLWGGTKLRTVFGKKCDYDVIGESWELSAHLDGQSVIADGIYKGMPFGEFLSVVGKDVCGWKCESLDRFPILIKFIDARQALSIQIHPDDEYALEMEGEYGKNEMWYVLDCDPGSYLYCGLSHECSKEELRQRIADNTITEVLNKIEAKPGDCVFVKAGTIHAIGAGILICEIQQNSNSTYRMYDYDRRDKFGNTRELHVDKAMDVVNTEAYDVNSAIDGDDSTSKIDACADAKDSCTSVLVNTAATEELLVRCKYFQCEKYSVTESVELPVDTASFISVIVLSGQGVITVNNNRQEFKAGDSFFVTAGHKNVRISGNCDVIVTRV